MTTSLGEQLQQAREARFLNLEQAAHATHIRLRYLQALEAGDLSAFPSPAQAKGFLRAYAEFLGLDSASLSIPANQPAASGETPPAAPSSAPSTSAGQIFAQIGQKLRNQRAVLGLSLEDVERHTHLRLHYLQSLESGNLDGLPSPVQGRGMLQNYARFLGMDAEPLLLQLADGLQARLNQRQSPAARQTIFRASASPPSAARRMFSTEMIAAGVVALSLLVFLGWGLIRVNEMRAGQTPTATAPPLSQVLAGLPTATATPSSPQATPTASPEAGAILVEDTPTPTLPPASNAPLQVYVVARQRAWLRVTVDGKVEFDGRTQPGSAYPFAGNDRIELLTGSGAALQVLFNTNDLGALGGLGEVAHRVFTLEGVQTPTATITPTPAPATPTPIPTPAP